MATDLNGRPGRTKDALALLNFRVYRPELGSPASQGFYHGFPCHLGHTLRDEANHWCHNCAHRIHSNIVGFNISFTHEFYTNKALTVINMLKDSGVPYPDECWDIGEQVRSRICYPSYRSQFSKRTMSDVSIKKIIYQLFWGDIGKGYVTRNLDVCENENCVNPLHLSSTFNQMTHGTPQTFQYLDLTPHPKKLMLMRSRQQFNLTIDDILSRVYKPTIRDPKIDKQ